MGLIRKLQTWWNGIRTRRVFLYQKGDILVVDSEPGKFFIIMELDLNAVEYVIESQQTGYWLRHPKISFEAEYKRSYIHNTPLFKRLNIDLRKRR